MVDYLLLQGADPNASTLDGSTALMNAVIKGHFKVVKTLVKAEAKIDIQNQEGKTALYKAAQFGHIHIFDLLASRGANVNLKLPENAATLKMVKHLVLKHQLDKMGRDVNMRIPENDSTLLMSAVFGQHTDTVVFLLQHGAKINDR